VLTPRSPGRLGVVIGDACGRGAEGAALLALILPKVDELTRAGATPANLLAELNHTGMTELAQDRFVTAIALELDLRAGVMTVANAAHVPAMVRRGSDVSIVGLASGPPLGFARETRYIEETHSLRPHDLIVLMTDGVLEAVETNLSTMSNLRRLVSSTGTTMDGASVHRLLLRLFDERSRGRRPDDMTLLVLEPLTRAGSSSAHLVPQVLSCAS
jgi:serine phosphatase RsbU (regulator of sigma subunit)